jgi:hypothetical protein
MNRAELAILSQAHAVAMTAMVAPETREIPLTAARVLHRELRDHRLAEDCARFTAELHLAHGDLMRVASAGRMLRDAVASAMAYVPPDIQRVDIHG